MSIQIQKRAALTHEMGPDVSCPASRWNAVAQASFFSGGKFFLVKRIFVCFFFFVLNLYFLVFFFTTFYDLTFCHCGIVDHPSLS